MTIDDSTKNYILRLLKRGLITKSEAARMAGVNRQLMNYWTREIDTDSARSAYLEKLLARKR